MYVYYKSLSICIYVTSARKEKGHRVGQQLDIFIRAVIKKEKVNNNGETSFEMDWNFDNVPLCKLSYSLLFKIPKNKFEAWSKAMKAAGSRYVDSINHQPFKDNHVHDFMLLGWFCSAFVVKKWRVAKMFCWAPSNKR